MALTLTPELEAISRVDLEAHIAAVQSRRLVAAVMYYQGENAKHLSKIDKADKRLILQYTKLQKKFATLDKTINEIETIGRQIDMIKGEKGLHSDMVQVFDTDANEDDEE